MFSTFKQRLLLGIYIFIVLSIPVGAYLASQAQTYKSSAQEAKSTKVVKSTPLPSAPPMSGVKELLSVSDEQATDEAGESSPTIATSFGPTLSLTAVLEGRPANNQATKLFVGIVEGALTSSPKFLLSFTLKLPESGSYSNLSLAGLTPGSKYTALLKGTAQIATASAFLMSPTVTNLNDGQPINMLTGDLNEDNVINSSDYTIALKVLGSNSKSSNWNKGVDFNDDGLVNIFDLATVTKNMGRIGASGAWTSPPPKSATPSGTLVPWAFDSASPSVGSPDQKQGYWLWIPQ